MPIQTKPLLHALAGNATSAPPIWLMRQAGRYLPEYRALRARAGTFLDLCYTPELAVEATLQPIRRFPLDAAIIFSDILVVPHAMGRDLRFEEGRGPVLDPISTEAEVERLTIENLDERLAPVYQAIGTVAVSLPDAVSLIGFAGAPWTIACYMVEGGTSRDLVRIRRLAYEAPDLLDRLIGALTAAVSEHLVMQVRAGAEVVQVFDTWAGVLPPAGLRRYSLEPIRAIAAAVKADTPEVPVIAFPRGVGDAYRHFATEDGIAAVSIDYTVDPGWAAHRLQPDAAVQGNLDPVALLAGGAKMEEEILGIRNALDQGPFVFNLGHGVLPETPPEHVERLIHTVKGTGG